MEGFLLYQIHAKIADVEIPAKDLEPILPWNIDRSLLGVVDDETTAIIKGIRPAVPEDFL